MLHIPLRAKEKKKRRTPMRRQPQHKRMEMTARDIAIFKLLSGNSEHRADPEFRAFRYLTRAFIYALLPEEVRGGWYGFMARMTDLLHELYLKVPDERRGRLTARQTSLITKDTLNELGEGGQALTGGIKPEYFGSYEHRVLTDIFRAYLSIALSEHPEFRFTKFYDILELDNVPEETKSLPEPNVIFLGYKKDKNGNILKDLKGRPRRIELEPDYPLCRIEHFKDGEWHSAFLLTEIDCGTEPLHRNGPGTSIERKIDAYEIALESAVKNQYGIKKSPVYVLFFTIGETRRDNMATLAKSSKYADRFLFTHVDGFDGHEALPVPHTDFLTMPLKTANGTFRFSDL